MKLGCCPLTSIREVENVGKGPCPAVDDADDDLELIYCNFIFSCGFSEYYYIRNFFYKQRDCPVADEVFTLCCYLIFCMIIIMNK